MCIAAIFDKFCTYYRWSNVNCQLCKGMKNYVSEGFLLLCSIWGHLYFLKDVNILSTHINGKKHFSSQLFFDWQFCYKWSFLRFTFSPEAPDPSTKTLLQITFSSKPYSLTFCPWLLITQEKWYNKQVCTCMISLGHRRIPLMEKF